MNESILVAGGAGYIGAHVCKALAAAGHVPVTLDNLITGHRDFVRWGPLYEASVSDADAVSDAIKIHSIKAVIDLSGSIEVAESMSDPLKYYANNVGAKIGFLQTLQACGISAFVLSSTAAVYGEPQQVPIAETHPLAPKNPYGRTKLIFEQMLADLALVSGLRWAALRYFNAAGASAEGEIGEAHDPETHLMPRACFAALGKAPILEIYGNDYPTADGMAIRDYVHVEDLATAHVRAVQALLNEKASFICNLGSGQGHSIGEIIACFKRLGHSLPHEFKPRRSGDPAKLVADITSAKNILDWTPAHTLEVMVGSALRWHKARITT